jgi:hypothetical protein
MTSARPSRKTATVQWLVPKSMPMAPVKAGMDNRLFPADSLHPSRIWLE